MAGRTTDPVQHLYQRKTAMQSPAWLSSFLRSSGMTCETGVKSSASPVQSGFTGFQKSINSRWVEVQPVRPVQSQMSPRPKWIYRFSKVYKFQMGRGSTMQNSPKWIYRFSKVYKFQMGNLIGETAL